MDGNEQQTTEVEAEGVIGGSGLDEAPSGDGDGEETPETTELVADERGEESAPVQNQAGEEIGPHDEAPGPAEPAEEAAPAEPEPEEDDVVRVGDTVRFRRGKQTHEGVVQAFQEGVVIGVKNEFGSEEFVRTTDITRKVVKKQKAEAPAGE